MKFALLVLLVAVVSASDRSLLGRSYSKKGKKPSPPTSPPPSPPLAPPIVAQCLETCEKAEDGPNAFCNREPIQYNNESINRCCEDDYCTSCHSNGCNKCCDGAWKFSYFYPCVPCCDYDPFATRCADFIGSQQCVAGYQLVRINAAEALQPFFTLSEESERETLVQIC